MSVSQCHRPAIYTLMVGNPTTIEPYQKHDQTGKITWGMMDPISHGPTTLGRCAGTGSSEARGKEKGSHQSWRLGVDGRAKPLMHLSVYLVCLLDR